MRTIKFKGRTFNGTIWAYGLIEMLRFDDGHWHYYIREYKQNGGYTDYEVDPKTIGQFTGLHDKNGKEIYEGDVITWLEIKGTNNNSFLDPPDDRIVEMSGVVEFKDGVFSVLNEDKLLDAIVAYLTKDYQANESNMFEYVYNLDKFPNITIDDMYICEVIGNIYDNKEQTQTIKQ